MPYPEPMVAPMRAELTRLGVIELRDTAAVDAAFNTPGTMVLVVNSVCGCAAANARPAIGLATQAEHQPDQYVTVFAGQDMEATARARELMPGIPPSSPFIALLKDGDPVYVIERRHIEGRSASAIATDLVGALGAWCAEGATGEGHPSSPAAMPGHGSGLPPTFRSIR